MISNRHSNGQRRSRIFFRQDETAPQKPAAQTVAAYVRVSTEEQAQSGYSIPAQIEKLEAMCRSQDWKMLPTYVDDGYSGKNMDRPAIQRLLADARRNKFDVILVYKLDRFSRRLSDLVSLGEELEKIGIGLRSLTEPFDTTYPAGKLLFNMLGSFAQFERELIGERTRLALRRRLSGGQWNGRPPYGYRMSKEGRLELHPGDAPYAKRVFQLFLEQGLGVKLTARRLTEEDRSSTRSGRWQRTSVWNMLTNPVYAGQVVIGNEVKNLSHPAVITKEQFELIQQRLKSNALTPSEQLHSPHFLTGILKCGRCGRPMTTAKGKGKYYYACGKRLIQGGCDLEYIPAQAIESCILHELRRLSAHPEMIEKYLAANKAQNGELLERLRLERAAVQHRLDASTRAKDAKVRWLAENLPQKNVADEVSKEIDRQLQTIGELGKEANDVDRRIETLAADTAKSEEISLFLRYFYEGFGSMSLPQRRRMIRSLVKEVTVRGISDAKIVFSIPLTGPLEWKTGPREVPFSDEDQHEAAPLHVLPSPGIGSRPGPNWLRA